MGIITIDVDDTLRKDDLDELEHEVRRIFGKYLSDFFWIQAPDDPSGKEQKLRDAINNIKGE